MTDCKLQQIESGKWWCPKCDPERKRLLPVKAHRNCRAEHGRQQKRTRRSTADTTHVREAADRLGIGVKWRNYAKALLRWKSAGYPVRSQAEIDRIYTEHCLPCEHIDAKNHECLKCGCPIKRVGIAVKHKLKMATEKCPVGKWDATI